MPAEPIIDDTRYRVRGRYWQWERLTPYTTTYDQHTHTCASTEIKESPEHWFHFDLGYRMENYDDGQPVFYR
jgi:hypothetical protein